MSDLKAIRQRINTQRKRLSNHTRHSLSLHINRRLKAQRFFRHAQRIAFYWPARGEVDTRMLLTGCIQQHQHCFLPVLHPIKHNQLWFLPYKRHEPLILNIYNIREPVIKPSLVIAPWTLDVVVMPLVAFDQQCSRVGMGAGYYDRTLGFILAHPHRPRPTLVGLAYEFQKIDHLKRQPWDIPLDWVVTEEKLYTRS